MLQVKLGDAQTCCHPPPAPNLQGWDSGTPKTRACWGQGFCVPQFGVPRGEPCAPTFPPSSHCPQATGRCECRPGFVGRACDLALGENRGGGRWYNVSEGDPGFPPRTAAAGAVLPRAGALYVFGGEMGGPGGSWGLGGALESYRVGYWILGGL